MLKEKLSSYYEDDNEKEGNIHMMLTSKDPIEKISWREKFEASSSVEELDLLLEDFEADATWTTFSNVVAKNLNEFFPVNSPADEPNAKKQADLALKYLDYQSEHVLKEMKSDERDLYLGQIQISIAQDIFEKIIEQKLVDNVEDKKIIKEYKNTLLTTYAKCLSRDEPSKIAERVDICSRKIKMKATKNISLYVMKETIRENILDKGKRKEAYEKVEKNTEKCIRKGSKIINVLEFDNHLDSCTSLNALVLAREIGESVSLEYSKLIGSKYSEKQLSAYLKSTTDFQSKKTKRIKRVSQRDPSVRSHLVFKNCLDSIKEDIITKGTSRRGYRAVIFDEDVARAITSTHIALTEVTKDLDVCSEKYQQSIIGYLKKEFLRTDLEGKKKIHQKRLDQVFDILALLRGKATKGQEASDPKDLFELMKSVGEATIVACNYDDKRCNSYMKKTHKLLVRYKKNNPEATGDDIIEEFYKSPYMKFLVRANISDMVSEKLRDGFSQYYDKEGILEREISFLTDSELMERLLRSRSGKKLVALVTKAIKNDKMDDIEKDPKVRQELANSFLSKDSVFLEQLTYGLVDSKLREENRKVSLKIWVAKTLGVVDGRKFNWKAIKDTKEGRKAKELFRTKVMIPQFLGKDISLKEMDEIVEEIEDAVTSAIIKVSKPKKRPVDILSTEHEEDYF